VKDSGRLFRFIDPFFWFDEHGGGAGAGGEITLFDGTRIVGAEWVRDSKERKAD
jgi:hypothetical protein